LAGFSVTTYGRIGVTAEALVPNELQQMYFADVTTDVILPTFAERDKPFVLIYWSRDPDGTQHNQADSINSHSGHLCRMGS
jgi:hypothetical protein